jgi:hypothetical protein
MSEQVLVGLVVTLYCLGIGAFFGLVAFVVDRFLTWKDAEHAHSVEALRREHERRKRRIKENSSYGRYTRVR